MEENGLKSMEKLVVIGGSAGSLDVLLQVLPKLNRIETLALVIVLHRRNSDDNILEELLRMKTGLPTVEIEDKTQLKPGRIHIAPPDYHLLFERDMTLSLDISEKINYSRPSIDIAFESAADAFGKKVVAILLSGANADGTEGLRAVKEKEGMTVIQSPETADVPFMPAHAIANVAADQILQPSAITELLNGMA